MGSRKSMEAGGARGRRQERRGNTLHSSPGLTVLDVSSSRGQIRTGMDTRPHSQADLNCLGWERPGRTKALGAVSHPHAAGQPCRAGRAAGSAGLTTSCRADPEISSNPWGPNGGKGAVEGGLRTPLPLAYPQARPMGPPAAHVLTWVHSTRRQSDTHLHLLC